ncbi:hypothetical protein HK102_010740, partial [Quaeritorhiza haematococci]
MLKTRGAKTSQILQPAGSSLENKAKVSVNLLLELAGDYLRRDSHKEDESKHESSQALLERNFALKNPCMIAKPKRDFEDIANHKQRKQTCRSKANNKRQALLLRELGLEGELFAEVEDGDIQN